MFSLFVDAYMERFCIAASLKHKMKLYPINFYKKDDGTILTQLAVMPKPLVNGKIVKKLDLKLAFSQTTPLSARLAARIEKDIN